MFNRETLQNLLANRVVEGMDIDTLVTYATERLTEAYDSMTDAQLQTEIEEYAPDLLEIGE